MKKIVTCIILVLALTGGILYGFTVIRPHPRPVGKNADFSNIVDNIAQITAVPHTAGSPENYAVRDMIIAQAASMGLNAEVLPFEMDVIDFINDYQSSYDNGSDLYRERMEYYMEQSGCRSIEEWARDSLNAGNADTLTLHNILIKISGLSPSGSAMFVSHYDHVKGAPGAADDALAVACMLHLMEVMSNNQPANDIYFLFTDGEENGLLGAADFVKTQPEYADEIDVLFNFEARGNQGAMLMFETSGYDYELVKHFKKNVPQPVTMSIATAIYANMPNGTDYTEFKNAGYYGLNFAMIEGDETYHQPSDNVENLNKDSAWQYYETITALGNYFGNADLKQIENTTQALYFPLPILGIVVIPDWTGYIIGFIPLLISVIFSVFIMKRQKKKRSGRILHMTGVLLLGVIPAAITIFFFSGSYMFSIPAVFFLLADWVITLAHQKQKWFGIALLVLAVLISASLYTPLLFLMQVALKLWYITLIIALFPLIPAVIYSGKGICSI